MLYPRHFSRSVCFDFLSFRVFSAVGFGGLFISSLSQVVWSATCAMLFEGVLYRIAVLVLRLLSDVVLKGRPASGFYFQLGFLV